MNTCNQIEMDEDVVGKIVRRIHVDDDKCAIVFNDDTFVYLKLEGGWEGSSMYIVSEIEHPDTFVSTFGVDAGIIPAEVLEKREAIWNDMQRRSEEIKARQLYENLKKRFE